jgi:DNA-binding NarL/FixJ family response regulator
VQGVADPRRRSGLLSARERGVLRLVAAGLSNRQIGETLSISERTVKFHVTAIFNKLGADNRAQAVAIAAERGLLS